MAGQHHSKPVPCPIAQTVLPPLTEMTTCKFYLTSSVLLCLLLSLSVRTSTAMPVRTLSADKCQQCSMLFRSLLLNVTELLKDNDLCFGISSDTAVVRSTSETVLACAPTLTQSSGCTMQRNSTFNETECLRNIMKDLAYYAATFESYMDSPLRSGKQEVALLSPTLGIIKSLMENCSPVSAEERDSSKDITPKTWGKETFRNRQEMCKIMRGFYTRTITINRAMGYIASGEHRK